MDRIKDTLLLLCNFVNKLFDEKIVSAHFSHAKFNRTNDQVVQVFWRIIHKVVCNNHIKCSDEVTCSKTKMLKTCGYKMIGFYALPHDFSYGSRELLIAFGKLIIDGKLEECLDRLVSESVLISEFGNLYNITNVDQQISNYSTLTDFSETPNTLLFKAGKIRKLIKNLELLKQSRLDETIKVHAETSSMPCVPHLSALEVLVLSKKKLYYSKYQKQLLHISGLIDAYFLWIKRKKQFFAWLETVIDLKENSEDSFSMGPLNDMSKKLTVLNHSNDFREEIDGELIQCAVSRLLDTFEDPMRNNGFKILQ